MQVITTKYLGATNTRPARITAKTTSGIKRTTSWNYEHNTTLNHLELARALARELKWGGEWFMGDVGERGYVFVCRQGSESFTIDSMGV